MAKMYSMMSPLSCKWTSLSLLQKNVSPRPHFPAVIQHLLLPHAPPWHLPPKQSQVSMIIEVSELLLQAVLDTSSHALGSSTPKRPASVALGAPSSLRVEDSAKPVDTSSQASLWADMPDDAELSNQTLQEIYAPPSPPVKTPGPGTGSLPKDVIQLQKEANRALGCLLTTRYSLDACQRKQVLDFEMALHQNESETCEAIMEAKALCDSTIREAKAHWTTVIREAEAWHATCIREAKANYASTIAKAEGCCSMAIRKAESCCAKQACSIQLSQAEGVQHLEMEATEEQGKDHLSSLAACGTALQACPPEAHGVLMAPSTCLWGTCLWPLSWAFPPGILHSTQIYPTSLSLYYPCCIWALAQIQTAIPFPWLGCIHTLIRRCCWRGLWRTAQLEVKGWDASSQIIDGESVGSLCQRFRSSTEG